MRQVKIFLIFLLCGHCSYIENFEVNLLYSRFTGHKFE